MSGEVVKKDKNMIHFLIFCVIASLGWIIPPIEPITEAGMRLLTVFLASVYGWTVTNEVWPSLMSLLLLPFTGMITLSGVLSSSWGSDMAVFMILFFAYITFLQETGTTTYIAAYLMTRDFLRGHPWRMVFMVFFVAWFLASFTKTVPAILITWGFVYKLCDILGYKPFDKFSNLMVFGVAIMGILSLSVLPWANTALVILNSYAASSGVSVNYLHYMIYSVPYAMFSMFAYMALCKFVFKLDVSKLKDLDPNVFSKEDLTLTKERMIAMISLVALVLALLVPSLLPKSNIVYIVSEKMGLTLKLAFMFVVLSLIRIDGKQIFNFAQLSARGVAWNMVAMVMPILIYVSILGNSEAGIGAFLSSVFTPLFVGKNGIVLLVLIALITIFATNFMVNIVVAAMMMTAAIPIATALGIDSLQIIYLITVASTIAFLLPPACGVSAILFANTEWVRPKDIYKYGFPTIIVLALIAVVWNIVVFMFI